MAIVSASLGNLQAERIRGVYTSMLSVSLVFAMLCQLLSEMVLGNMIRALEYYIGVSLPNVKAGP